MRKKERGFLAFILVIIICLVSIDLITDFREGVPWWHLAVEGSVALAAALGIFVLMRDSFALKHRLEDATQRANQLQSEAQLWREQTRKYAEGLSQEIDRQLTEWNLTSSEKEVALLLLKGLSSKEIAEIRNTGEKTVRAQAAAVYSKSGLAGRSELAAFFLEDLFSPPSPDQ